MKKKSWSVYLVQCVDGTLYCGATPDVAERLKAHNAGKGARYTRGRGPVALVYARSLPSQSEALREERRIKRLPRAAKQRLIRTQRRSQKTSGKNSC